ncbi:beta-lactamase/transpeptidase-like protein [Mycena rebaudengoi]|nr:beta-lactamase/transpeptidase-like protein [Mycena rebaudengoi]
MNLLAALSVLTFLAAASASDTQIPLNIGLHRGKVISDEFSTYIRNRTRTLNISGLALGVLRPDGQVEYGSWGNRTEEGDPVTPATVFNIGSCSKVFLPAALGILMQDFAIGKNKTALPSTVSTFDWDTKMQDLLPEEWMANLKDLLSHVTGLPYYDLSYAPSDTAQDNVLRIRHLRAAYELREHYEYNNIMYVTDTLDYLAVIEQRIMQLLGMAFNSGNLTQVWTTGGRRIPFYLPERSADMFAGAGGLKWVKLHLSGGVDAATSVSLIPSSTFDLATSVQSIALPKGNAANSLVAYGMGWSRNSYRGHEVVKHNGGAPGVAAWVAFYPHDNFGLVILDNSKVSTTSEIEHAVADRILGLSTEPLTPESTLQSSPSEVSPNGALRSSSSPPLDLFEYTGTYMNPGYGNITICARESTSSVCRTVVNDFETVDRGTGHRLGASHIRFTHVSENSFALATINLYINGYGADKTPFENASGS